MPATATAKTRSSAGAKPRSKRGSQLNSGRGGWKSLWPLLLGIAVTPFAMRVASILALEGPKAFALLYPWVIVLRSPALHIPAGLAASCSQWAMMLQFPLYGLLITLTCRAEQILRAFITGLVAHFFGLFAVVVLAYMGA